MKNLSNLWSKSPELVDDIGGEVLAGSGFEREHPDPEFDADTVREGEEE